MFSPYSFESVGKKQRQEKLWNRAQNFNKQKKVSVPTLFFKY